MSYFSNSPSQTDILDQIWSSARNSIGKELLSDSKLVPVPMISNADDFDLFSVFVKSKSENMKQKIRDSLAGPSYHVLGHVSQVIHLQKSNLDRLLGSAKPHQEDFGKNALKWEKDIDLESKSVHLTIEGLHKYLISLNMSEGDICLNQKIPDLIGAKSVYIITDVLKSSRVTACMTSDDDKMEVVSSVCVPIAFGYSKFRVSPEGFVAEQIKNKPSMNGKWEIVTSQITEFLNDLS